LREGVKIYAADEKEGLTGPVFSIKDSFLSITACQYLLQPYTLKDPIFDQAEKKVWKDSVVFELICTWKGQKPSAFIIHTYAELTEQENFTTDEQDIKLVLAQVSAQEDKARIPIIHKRTGVSDCAIDDVSGTETIKKSGWQIFILGFLGGLIALLTPCVFPMIPLTVSFFTKKSPDKKTGIRNATLYGIFILLIYLLLSLPFHFLDAVNPELLNNISTSVYLNVIFFIVFIVFALSFFGLFEITLPASLTTGSDSKAGTGNIMGIFFMSLTLAIVSFSCTGPILGSLLAGSLSSDGGAWQLTIGMGSFGLALALPFALFALFPQWLQSLPKSGGWLQTVKVTLGFLEVALAFKFLSNADMVMHWGLLKREIFIGIWVLTGIGLSLYLFGLLRFSKNAPKEKLSKGRLMVATVIALFTFYLLPGLTNTTYANLKWISGFPPPLYYSIYEKESDCILGLNCTKDYFEGLAIAKRENKPILLDFTGYACVNCRRMEENVWSDARINDFLRDKFIVVSLYVDDKKSLPAIRQFSFSQADGQKKEIRTVGDQWATMETVNFSNNAQPLYVIIDPNENTLASPVGYTPDKEAYYNWLNCGWDAFQSQPK
jgi:thiol:disulfide interchange protein DsbD